MNLLNPEPTSGLVALFVIMLLKEIGIPVPVPSDLIMITAGIQAATGAYSLPGLILVTEIAVFVGCSIQFLLVRGAGRSLVYRFGRYVGLTEARLDEAGASLRRRGPMAVFVGLNLPAARAGIVAAAGIAGVGYGSFAPAMLAGSTVFYGWHVALGFIVGPAATSLLSSLNLPLAPIVAVLALLGLGGWLLLRRRRGAATVVECVHTWTEAACPACLAATAIQRSRSLRIRPASEGMR
ncbi:MAG: hypothetical protein QOF51_2451 [Chloroflexota bacterium]|jgi:membrane protein DedA with SNARE-associated domain|nr:hypothetical protein [Chloroflexota bacterium]